MIDKILKLTSTVYKVLDFFPESDPLKNRAKDKALVVMEDIGSIYKTDGHLYTREEENRIKIQILENIDILLGYLWIAKTQGWISAINCLIISNEYKNIENKIKVPKEATEKLPIDALKERRRSYESKIENSSLEGKTSERQEKIIEFLKSNQKAQVMDLQMVLPKVTKRTIRRDLDELLLRNKIIRKGEFNQVFYQIS